MKTDKRSLGCMNWYWNCVDNLSGVYSHGAVSAIVQAVKVNMVRLDVRPMRYLALSDECAIPQGIAVGLTLIKKKFRLRRFIYGVNFGDVV